MKRLRALVKLPLALLAVAGMIWVGAVHTVGLVREIGYGMASLDWPATVGTVESSRLEVRQGRSYRRIAHITYRYELGGRLLRSGRIGASNQHDRAPALVAALPPGTPVRVYYDPDTGMPALVRGYNRGAWGMLALMLGVTAVPVMLVAAAMRRAWALRWARPGS